VKVTLNANKWYVYTHSIDDDVFYVGMGNSHRPFILNHRNKTWHEIVNGSDVNVEIAREFETKADAFEYEKWLTRALDPEANVFDKKMLRKADGCKLETVLRKGRR